MARRARAARPAAGLRIIGGAWRGRRIAIGDAPGLRPTPARVRETLFDWLAQRIVGARCIDLFAGTGALGLEALSRGAAHVDFVEQNPKTAEAVRTALCLLGATARATVTTGDALKHVRARRPADIVFIDPPFGFDLHADAAAAAAPLLAAGARIYVEYPAAAHGDIERLLGDDFELLRAKRAGAVGYCLARALSNSPYCAP